MKFIKCSVWLIISGGLVFHMHILAKSCLLQIFSGHVRKHGMNNIEHLGKDAGDLYALIMQISANNSAKNKPQNRLWYSDMVSKSCTYGLKL